MAKYINRHIVKPFLKQMRPLLIGFQKTSQNEDYVYIWMLEDISDTIALNFIENAKVFPRNSYIKIYTTKEEVWELFSHYLEEREYTKEKFKDFETDTFWIDAKGRFKEFIPIMEIDPINDYGEPIKIQTTNSTNLPKFLQDKISNNEFSTDEEKRNYIEEQIKSHMVSLVDIKGEELDIILMPMSDSKNNLLFDEYEIVRGEIRNKLIEAVPVSYDVLKEQLIKF